MGEDERFIFCPNGHSFIVKKEGNHYLYPEECPDCKADISIPFTCPECGEEHQPLDDETCPVTSQNIRK